METLNPELKAFLMQLPNGIKEIKDDHNRRFEKIESKLDEAVYVNLTNGDGQKVKVANILPRIHNDLKEVKEATEFLRDFAKLHKIFTKYKIYWIVIIIFTGWQMGDPIFQIIKDLIK